MLTGWNHQISCFDLSISICHMVCSPLTGQPGATEQTQPAGKLQLSSLQSWIMILMMIHILLSPPPPCQNCHGNLSTITLWINACLMEMLWWWTDAQQLFSFLCFACSVQYQQVNSTTHLVRVLKVGLKLSTHTVSWWNIYELCMFSRSVIKQTVQIISEILCLNLHNNW